MGKKNKRKAPDMPIVYPIELAVSRFQKKYEKLLALVADDQIRTYYERSTEAYQKEHGISWEIFSSFFVEKEFFLQIRKEIEEGNIDLEIAMIAQYASAAKMMLRAIQYETDKVDMQVELAITNAIENYDGKNNFQSCILAELKNMKRDAETPKISKASISSEVISKKIVTPREENSTPAPIEKPLQEEKLDPVPIEHPSQEEKLNPVPIEQSSQEESFLLPIRDGKLRPPTELDQLLHDLDIVKKVPLEDAKYVQFLSLKYGYYQQNFFRLEEIGSILSLPEEEVGKYYQQSLQFVKDWFGMQLDQYYTYTIKSRKE